MMFKVYEKFVRPLLFAMDAEKAHEIGISALRKTLASESVRNLAAKTFHKSSIEIERFGLKFPNVLGVAAGFDKNGTVVEQLAAIGFGFVEAGTVTFNPQAGNPKPRMFRLPTDQAVINRLGFNNRGAAELVSELKNKNRRAIVGVNIGKNKDVAIEDAAENYLKCFEIVHEVADYIAINVSSPNTPQLREMQKTENLEELLAALQKKNVEMAAKPLLLKIAPDLSEDEVEKIVDVALKHDISGVIVSNTTVSRDGLRTNRNVVEEIGAGGISGRPLAKMSNRVISKIFRITAGQLPIIGVGGVFTGQDAFEKIAAGACMVQAYTGFIYRGPGFAKNVNRELNDILQLNGFSDVDAAIGSNSFQGDWAPERQAAI